MKIQTATARIIGISPYSQGGYVSQEVFPIEEGENNKEWDHRIWKEKAHYNKAKEVVIPAMSLKLMMSEITKRDNQKIKGKGAKHWHGVFKTSILVTTSPVLLRADGKPWTRENMTSEIMLTGQEGKKNELKYPTFQEWMADVEFIIVDPLIKKEIFQEYLDKAGYLTGLGRYRVGRGWLYGSFTVEDFKWSGNVKAKTA